MEYKTYSFVMRETDDMSNDHVTEMVRRDEALMAGRRAGYEWGYSDGVKRGLAIGIGGCFAVAIAILALVAAVR